MPHFVPAAVSVVFLLFSPSPQTPSLPQKGGETAVLLRSTHEARRYALWLEPANLHCGARAHVVLERGQMRARAVPGEGVLMSLGSGFAPGVHHLHLSSPGCDHPPRVLRQVALGRTSPDHGWRLSALATAR